MGAEERSRLHYVINYGPTIASVDVDVTLENGACKLSVLDWRDYELPFDYEGDADAEAVERCLLGPLAKLPWRYGAYKVPDVMIKDGTGWSLYIKHGGRMLMCYGHERYPDGFDAVTDGLIAVVRALAEGRDPFEDAGSLSAWERTCENGGARS